MYSEQVQLQFCFHCQPLWHVIKFKNEPGPAKQKDNLKAQIEDLIRKFNHSLNTAIFYFRSFFLPFYYKKGSQFDMPILRSSVLMSYPTRQPIRLIPLTFNIWSEIEMLTLFQRCHSLWLLIKNLPDYKRLFGQKSDLKPSISPFFNPPKHISQVNSHVKGNKVLGVLEENNKM